MDLLDVHQVCIVQLFICYLTEHLSLEYFSRY